MKLAQRAQNIIMAETRRVTDMADKLRNTGKSVISLAMGEPDFATPQAAVRYAIDAMEKGKTHYPAVQGVLELRKEITAYYTRRFGVSYNDNQIIVGTGAKLLLYEALGVVVDPGDEVLVLTPAWVSYTEQIKLLGGIPVLVDTESNGFMPDIGAIKKAVTEKTVAIIVNSPNNPTGAIYTETIWHELCQLAVEKDLLIINDEIYEYLSYAGMPVHPLRICPEIRERLISINGISKTYAMTGWRIGFALGGEALIGKMICLQGHITSGAASISQWAAVGALREALTDAEHMKEQYRKRCAYIVDRLQAMPYITIMPPKGAFYVFPDITACYGRRYSECIINNDRDFCDALMTHYALALVPGHAFFCAGYVRISYAASMACLEEAMNRLEEFLHRLC